MKSNGTEIEQSIEPVPYIVHESNMARADAKNKRLWITLNALLVAITIIGVIRCLNKPS